jgi:hypothetical protein
MWPSAISVALYNVPNSVVVSRKFHLRMETDPVSETFCSRRIFFFFTFLDFFGCSTSLQNVPLSNVAPHIPHNRNRRGEESWWLTAYAVSHLHIWNYDSTQAISNSDYNDVAVISAEKCD